MRTRHFTLGIALFLLTGVVGVANAKTQQVHCKGSGTLADGVETHIDVNGDGASATLDQGLENCNIGRFFFQEELEWILQRTLTNCPAGTSAEYHISAEPGFHPAPNGQGTSVGTDEKTGDQLFNQVTSATLCFNISTIPFTFTASGQTNILGGTGKYAGATGTGSFQTVGSELAVGVKDGVFGGFGQFTATSDGTLTLPHGGNGQDGNGKDD